jgi:signal transduction histidine kinase
LSGFKVSARTLFHLGADLISSDAMALYELVKNAFDAGSERVSISVRQRCRIEVANPVIDRMATLLEKFESFPDEAGERGDGAQDEAVSDEASEGGEDEQAALERLRREALATLQGDVDLPFVEAVQDANGLRELFEAYSPVNEIVVSDTGHGMSLDDLETIFLTVGTMSRRDVLDERRREGVGHGERPILGEKGVGRLSAMRLGSHLRVETARLEDLECSILDIDWSLFSRKPEQRLEEIHIVPRLGGGKTRPKGTVLSIRQLTTNWSVSKLEDIAKGQFSRLNDPFETSARFPIDLAFNGSSVAIPAFRRMLLEHAHAVVSASFGPDDPADILPNGTISEGATLRLRGNVDYTLRNRSLPIDVSGTHLRTAAGVTDNEILRQLGPFELKIYWFNRPLLEEVDTIGTKKQVRELVNEWSGGVAVYRDGFRVGGYGSGADDWLGLDRKALASGGYKVNRAQLIGRLGISSLANPELVDQTNREGLRDSPEKDALIALLKHVIEGVFRPFLNAVDDEIRAREPVDLKGVAERVLNQRRAIAATIRLLYERYPEVKRDPAIGGKIEEALTSIGEMMRSLEELGASYRKGRTELTVLAGIGLSVAAVAHELRQVTANAMASVDALRRRRSSADLPTALAPLGTQLKTLLTRLRVLDPLVTSGRQVKTPTDLVEWTETIVESAQPAFENVGMTIEFAVRRGPEASTFEARVVQGMVVQVVGNLLDNARYWLGRSVLEDPTFKPRVLVEVDVGRREIRVSDNGPGVPPAMRDTVFQAFVTTKPPGVGLGLGLFISREIAAYSDATIALLPESRTAEGFSTTFALSFRKASA